MTLQTDFLETYPAISQPLGRSTREYFQIIVSDEARKHGVTFKDIMSPCRKKPVAKARAAAMHRVRSEFGWSYPHIGKAFSRDHSTVIYACRKHVAVIWRA